MVARMVGHWAGKMVATSVVLKAHHSADQWVPMMVVQWGLPTALNSADWTVEKKAGQKVSQMAGQKVVRTVVHWVGWKVARWVGHWVGWKVVHWVGH
jgi:hypothetical protein